MRYKYNSITDNFDLIIESADIDHGSTTGLGDDDHTQYARTDGTRNVTGSQIFEANVTVSGNLTVEGTEFITNTETVTIEDNTIELNKGESGAGVTLGTAGIQIDRGSSTDAVMLWDEATDMWQAGIVGTVDDIALAGWVTAQIVTFSGTIDHDTIVNTHNLTTDIDHDTLTNYASNEHFLWATVSATIDHDTIVNNHNLTTDIDHDALTNFASNEHFTEASIDKYTQAEVDALILVVSGTSDDHSELNELDYASAGHTGFQPAGSYVTDSEMTTISGDLVSGYVAADVVVTNAYIAADVVVDAKIDTTSGTLQAEIDTKGTGDADYLFGANTFSGTGDIYCNDIHTAEATIYIGETPVSVVSGSLTVSDGAVYTATEVDNLFLAPGAAGAVGQVSRLGDLVDDDLDYGLSPETYFSINYTAEAGTNRALVVSTLIEFAAEVPTTATGTFGGVEMTIAVGETMGEYPAMWIFYLLEEDILPGEQSFVFSSDALVQLATTEIVTLEGVNQSSTVEDTVHFKDEEFDAPYAVNSINIDVSEGGGLLVKTRTFTLTTDEVYSTGATTTNTNYNQSMTSKIFGEYYSTVADEVDRTVTVSGSGDQYENFFVAVSFNPITGATATVPKYVEQNIETTYMGDPTVSGGFRFTMVSGSLNLDMYNGSSWDSKDSWS